MKILIIEDDPILLKMYVKKFTTSGFEVETAEEGEDGLRKASGQPDFILLDLMLPKFSGIEVLKKLKKNPQTDSIPVGIVTVVPKDQAEKEFEDLDSNVVHYWMKDLVTPTQVADEVEEFLKR